jgi:signal transduction histidine kinase
MEEPRIGAAGLESGTTGGVAGTVDVESLRHLFEVGRGVLSELDPEALFDRVLETAREITGARYAALGVMDESRRELERFLVRGIDEDEQHAIGDPPRGLGVLGELIKSPSPLRLADVGQHPRSYGFPVNHPPMSTFLGVPILVRGQAWGNLYLTEKAGGEFNQADEEAVVMLADWAGIAIEHARLYESAQRRGEELERAVRGLEAARAIALAIGGTTDLSRVLELIVKRGRALVQARSLLILLREGEELVVAASAGEVDNANGRRIPLQGSTSGEVLRRRRPERLADVHARLRIAPEQLGVKDAHAGLIVPLVYGNDDLGVLIAFNYGSEAGFADDDEQALRAFAANAATAVATAQTVAADRLREALAAAEGERRRWARELHDQTLQSLGALRIRLATARRKDDLSSWRQAGDDVSAELEREIANLRGVIDDLRPTVLDDFGLAAALRALAQRRSDEGLSVECELSPPEPVLGAELDTTVYRLVQEALTNGAKHAQAKHVTVALSVANGEISVCVQDDGIGFDPAKQTAGFGRAGMRERVDLAHGTLRTDSSDRGTTVLATIPIPGASPARTG